MTFSDEEDIEALERGVAIAETRRSIKSGDAVGVSVCGIAAVVTRVGRLASPNFDVMINVGEAGELTMRIREAFTDVQYGRAEDRYGWMERVVKSSLPVWACLASSCAPRTSV